MKKLLLVSTLLVTSVGCLAMQSAKVNPIDQIKAVDQGALKRNVSFEEDTITFNGTATKYSDLDAFLKVMDSILDVSQKRHAYLLKLWQTTPHDRDNEWLRRMQMSLWAEMNFLLDQFLKGLQYNANAKLELIEDKGRIHTFVLNVLTLFEKNHDLRILACKQLPDDEQSNLESQCCVGWHAESRFQKHANYLLARDVDVAGCFERMRQNDI